MTLQERAIAIEAAHRAGATIKSYHNKTFQVEYKGEIDLVTDADHAAEEVVCELLAERFPHYGLLAEEEVPEETEHSPRWIVDPLDGTTNFSRGYPYFAVSIALEKDEQIVLGVVYSPVLDELFVAEKGQGATLNGEPISVSGTGDLNRALLSSGAPYDVRQRMEVYTLPWNALVPQTLTLRQLGAAALDLCYVACGRSDGHFEVGLAPWDTAAGWLLVEEAGGCVTDFAGERFRSDSPAIVASNGRLHRELIAVLQ